MLVQKIVSLNPNWWAFLESFTHYDMNQQGNFDKCFSSNFGTNAMRFDLNTDLWKHLSHFDREETFKFVTWNYRIYWLTWKCLSVGVQEGDSFYRNLQHLTVPRATRQVLWERAGLSWNLDVSSVRRSKNYQWTNFKNIAGDCKGCIKTLFYCPIIFINVIHWDIHFVNNQYCQRTQ